TYQLHRLLFDSHTHVSSTFSLHDALPILLSILAVTLLSVTVGASVQASTITVEKGDTLWDLSQAKNTSVENIKTLNNLNTDLIQIGRHTSELQSRENLVCRLLLEKKKKYT